MLIPAELSPYLDTGTILQVIREWAEDLTPLLEKYLQLKRVNLVIEGGVGNGRIMPHIARVMFPNALWVGTDISDVLGGTRRRLRGEIDDLTLEAIFSSNSNPVSGVEKAIIWANCFDYELIQDIMKKTKREFPLLTSYNALFALLDRKMNFWETKRGEDVFSLEHIVGDNCPYIGQLHVSHSQLWKAGRPTNIIEEAFYHLEAAAQNAGWITDRTDFSLLLLRK